jgi:hypothetical protein
MALNATELCKRTIRILIALVPISTVFGHAILVNSTPKANETVAGPAVALTLTFNSAVDQARSILLLEQSDRLTSKVAVTIDRSSPEKLTGKASRLAPGAYKLRWQVLAVDGHITRGQLAFQVK